MHNLEISYSVPFGVSGQGDRTACSWEFVGTASEPGSGRNV